MNGNGLKIVLIIFISIVLLGGTFAGGVILGIALPDGNNQNAALNLPAISTSSDSTEEIREVVDTETLFVPFWETWEIIHKQYVDQPVDDEAMMRGAISGMLESLGDPHTSYMDPEQYEDQKTPLEGEYEGIGAWVDSTGEYLTIVSPIPNSPAEEAGLEPGDQVRIIDGEDMTGLDGEIVLKKILGPAGSVVDLTMYRPSEDRTFEVTITREKITIPSVEGEMLEDNIAYIQLSNFGQNTTTELRNLLQELLANDPVGLILDLRYNGGGYLDTSVEVLSEFLGPNKIALIEELGDGTRRTFETSGGGIATEIPMVVLVNEGSASASEITAGAIQDYERGLLVGVTTFGKGSVQNWIPLSNNQGAVRVTIARWLTPKERQIHTIGLDPDVVVEITEDDIENEVDSQLDKAIEILLEE